jgi:hypothetical protein
LIVLAPAPDAKFYWFSAGDILKSHPETGGEPLGIEEAARLHAFHLVELRLAAQSRRRAAADFHKARERELRLAIRALSDWRRAAGHWPWARLA